MTPKRALIRLDGVAIDNESGSVLDTTGTLKEITPSNELLMKWQKQSEDARLAMDVAYRALRSTAFDNCQDLFWRMDDGLLKVYVKCTDVFQLGTADLEEVTELNIGILEQSYADAKAEYSSEDGYIIFCCRVRGKQPLPWAMQEMSPAVLAMVNACGYSSNVTLRTESD